MAKKATEALGPAAAGSASYSPPPRSRNGVEVEFLIGCVVNGVPYTKGQKATLSEQVAADLRLASGIIAGGKQDDLVMRTTDAAGGERTADAAPARSSNDPSETMARGGGSID